MKHRFFTAFISLLLFCGTSLLSSCAPSHFDCPLVSGISCQSLEQINTRIDAGSLPLLALATLPHLEKKAC